MKRNNIVIDIDGVLADFESYFCWKFGWGHRELVSLDKRYPDQKDKIAEFVKSKYTYKSLAPIQLGLDIVKFLDEKGYNIEIVSSRPRGSFDVTYDWIKRRKIPFSNLIIEHINKLDKIKKLNPLFAVDDLPVISKGCRDAGIPCILVEHPWNQSDTVSPRVSNMAEFEFAFNRMNL